MAEDAKQDVLKSGEIDITPLVRQALGDALKDVPVQIEQYVKEAVAEAIPDAVRGYLQKQGVDGEAIDYLCRALFGEKPKSYKGEPKLTGKYKSVLDALDYLLSEKGENGGKGKKGKHGQSGQPESARDIDDLYKVFEQRLLKPDGEFYKRLSEVARTAAREAAEKSIDRIAGRVGLKGSGKAEIPDDAQLAKLVLEGLKSELDSRGSGGVTKGEMEKLDRRVEGIEGGMEEFLKGFREGGSAYNKMRELEARLDDLEGRGAEDLEVGGDFERQDGDEESHGTRKKHEKR